MASVLTILASLLIVVSGMIGLFRGVQRGFLALVGSLLGVVVVEMWGAPFAAWLEQTLGMAPSTAVWVASSLAFLFVAIFAGYGSGALIRKPKPLPAGSPKPPSKAFGRPAGFALGLINGAVMSSVLLQYASAWSANETIPTVIAESQLLSLLIDWFRWFLLGVALMIGVQAIIKWSIGTMVLISRGVTNRPQPKEQAKQPAKEQPKEKSKEQPKPQPAAASAPAAAAAPAASTSAQPQLTAEQKRAEQEADAKQLEILRRTADKIKQRIGDPSSKP